MALLAAALAGSAVKLEWANSRVIGSISPVDPPLSHALMSPAVLRDCPVLGGVLVAGCVSAGVAAALALVSPFSACRLMTASVTAALAGSLLCAAVVLWISLYLSNALFDSTLRHGLYLACAAVTASVCASFLLRSAISPPSQTGSQVISFTPTPLPSVAPLAARRLPVATPAPSAPPIAHQVHCR
jgi:hypothetical protein